MFRSRTPDLTKTDTLIGEGTIIEGNLKSQASIHIEGHVNGDISCDGDLTIGEQAVVKSNIEARHITIAGHVEGDVRARGKLSITTSGRLFGNVTCTSFTIEEGGTFIGHSTMPAAVEANRKNNSQPEEAEHPSRKKQKRNSNQAGDNAI